MADDNPKPTLSDQLRLAQAQFQGINPKEPGQWPIVPKVAAWAGVAVSVIVLGWFALISSATDELTAAQAEEPKLKSEYRDKLTQAVNLEALKKQKAEVEVYVAQLEKQLPGKAEMDALLSDINQAGLGRGLQFELFRPGQVVVKDYYAELPIAVKVSGHYNDIGAFAGDIANLSRIVTLHDLAIMPPAKDASGNLQMEATARTYRYLDPSEVAEAKRAASEKRKAAGGKAK
ncbi:MAG: type 4a pilus biogenesis protein PilO [Proteobacteria bacterium]|nr:type 4a pilus biogenesis protein PilO [Pseudomonadota bacterium]